LRDLLVTALIFGTLPLVFGRPWIGVMLYVLVSVMNIQHFGHTFALSMPFAMIIAITTMIGMVTTKDLVRLPINGTTVLLVVFPLWMCLTYAFALEHEPEGYRRWVEVMKIFFFALVIASIVNTRKQAEWLVAIIVVAVGFYGVKGGIFTITSGGSYRVWGPPGNSSITDNNAIAAALVMMVPLMFYLRSNAKIAWVKWSVTGAIGLSVMAILGSHSRGALVAAAAMVMFLWWKSRNKFLLGILMVALIPVAVAFMPDEWTSRMKTIETYEEDESAMGRINAWKMVINLAKDRPIIGGGFELYTAKTFARYAPNPLDIHSAHSIYFQMLGEHGYVGLLLFISLGIMGWINASKTIALSKSNPEHKWAEDLARMLQVSLIAYAVGGVFVNIGYWEILYFLLVLLVALRNIVQPTKSPLVRQSFTSSERQVARQS
jgi:putative inorganic carbon (hco3(-)) transporter